MLSELGQFALALALPVALIQSIVPMIGAARNIPAWMAVSRPAAFALLGLIGLSFAALTHAFIVNDFSVIAVFQNSHTAKPLLYKVAGVWGNHEGSMVLWIAILAVFGAGVAAFGRNLPPSLMARALAVQGMISAAFIAFILFTSNPFTRLSPAPLEGQGMNPILQDPGLAIHPPMLYLGYVGFSMAFSFAVAALIEGRVDAAWARWVRPWTLAAWTFLTLGIGLGSWWAYGTLGWGGWWFWDPVENASFIPWLTGTALLHSAIVVEKREALKSWTILLAIVTFSLSLLGTFLVRSGILTSVHAFASDPTRGVFVLLILATAIGGALTLYAIRAPKLEGGGLFAPLSREGALLLNNLFLATAAMTVLLGTLYPLFADALDLGKITVGPPYFNAVFVPLMVPLVIAAGIGPLLAWKRGDLSAAMSRLVAALGIALAVVAVLAVVNGADLHDLAAAGGLGLAAWLAGATITEWCARVRPLTAGAMARLAHLPRAAHGMTLAHLGMAVVIAGVTASTAWKQEHIQTLSPGGTIEMAGYTLRFDGADDVPGPNYDAMRGSFAVLKGGKEIAKLHPERRMYVQPRQATTVPSILSMPLADIYTVIGEPQDDQGQPGAFVTRIYYQPLVPWIWIGVLLMFGGGLVSLSDRRLRIGAPRRAVPDALPAAAE
jgi:cytochrome c-type biogenesis protein CcmF